MDFVRKLLNKKRKERMTAAEAIIHPWILKHKEVVIFNLLK